MDNSDGKSSHLSV